MRLRWQQNPEVLSMTRAVLFDLGDTLVGYYKRDAFPAILEACIRRAEAYLQRRGMPVPRWEEVERRVAAEDHEARNFRARPLELRLKRIFSLRVPRGRAYLLPEMCRAFLAPVFALARLYPDALDELAALRKRGLKLGIVSNTPWGSPSSLWYEEVARHGLTAFCDRVTFCRDVGWRKPARPIFDHILHGLGCLPEECVFVGDNPKWDVAGAHRLGMTPVLIDRSGSTNAVDALTIGSLSQLEPLLDEML